MYYIVEALEKITKQKKRFKIEAGGHSTERIKSILEEVSSIEVLSIKPIDDCNELID